MKKTESNTNLPSNYQAALNELTDLVADMENQTITVDDLAEKVQRALALIAFCETKLRQTTEAVQNTLT
ncbi:MAG: exodeoxyribonuclease VII small subunit [Sphingobacteriales bacterium]|jgi:exodeoxyribonuclease VII small subunit|nr:exodeoxyribonuclease VII small subunit [Sphingobacteriales bacterium]MBP9140089.1 exodeoxyribonuclease VII small subunit [Chitinophagales bacterium]MDA0197828.1 exodeoxyribonuclease VII small subunit [Bacteroidota bacterium]MBK6889950.1 exodeoxyribonuclease VII small subunit [Sphingobacteriales bacterium]MBK7527526.1 exodeoxyribonuclease VII small subunit [Sphingobacteriales bacterium]